MRSKRTGVKKIRDLAYRICQTYTRYAPLIALTFNLKPELLAALEAVNVACANVIAEIDKETQFED